MLLNDRKIRKAESFMREVVETKLWEREMMVPLSFTISRIGVNSSFIYKRNPVGQRKGY